MVSVFELVSSGAAQDDRITVLVQNLEYAKKRIEEIQGSYAAYFRPLVDKQGNLVVGIPESSVEAVQALMDRQEKAEEQVKRYEAAVKKIESLAAEASAIFGGEVQPMASAVRSAGITCSNRVANMIQMAKDDLEHKLSRDLDAREAFERLQALRNGSDPEAKVLLDKREKLDAIAAEMLHLYLL